MARRVDVFFSIVSPWAHLGHAPYLALAERRGVETAWRPLPLGPLFAETGGLPLAKRAPERRRYRDVELQRWAARRGRPVNLRPAFWPFDGALADRSALALVAAGHDPGAFAGAAMRGVWEGELDLASREVLAKLIDGSGFDADATLAAAEGDDTAAAYEANRRAGQEIGVFGSPTYVLDGEPFWGQDRLDLLDEALASGRPPYRPVEP